MGIISKLYTWGVSPLNDESTMVQWAAGLVLVLIAAFLWATVVKQVVD